MKTATAERRAEFEDRYLRRFLADAVRRRIVTVAFEKLEAGEITESDYRTRVERANDKGSTAPYRSLRGLAPQRGKL